MLGRERLRMVEGRRTKRAEARRNPFRGSFESSCRRWFVFRPVIGREWWRQDTWWRTDMRGGRSVGWTGVRSDTGESVGREKGREGGRADGGSIEQIHVAVGRTVRRPTVEHTTVGGTDGRAVRRSTVGHADSRQGGRMNGRTNGRAGGPTGWDTIKAKEVGADRTPDRAIGKSKERPEQTPTDVLCAWMQRSGAPAGQYRDGSQPCPIGGAWRFRLRRI